MTLDEMLASARVVVAALTEDHFVRKLAQGVIDMLGESQPCSFEPPVIDPGMVSIMDGPDPLYQFTPSETRAWCAMVLRAADEAEAMEARRG